MNVHLPLLLALVGSFCAFTHASPTVIPTYSDVGINGTVADVIPDPTDASIYDLTVLTGPPTITPEVAPGEVATTAITEEAQLTSKAETEEPVVETKASAAATVTAATTALEPIITDHPAVETAAPKDTTEADVQSMVTADSSKDVVIEDHEEEIYYMSSGHVVGIVIGALVAVVIIIAVVIVVVRRMGKYSP
uniref:uncharacterized protein si:ch211-156j16.1 n=1 Tax=Scatophagus argus TaxID=75038 RepID=UPI001ED7DDEA|nr:uncharacterized protein si:ch211-156j16.1 [Scatophagus argus]